MVSAAERANCKPSGRNLTRRTFPDGVTAVMLTDDDKAPAGTASTCGPTWRIPPAGPMVWVTESYGNGEQLRSPVPWRSVPTRSAWGVAVGLVGARGPGS